MIEQEIDTRDEEDLAMEAAHAAIEASRNGGKAPEVEAQQQEPVPEVAEPPQEGNQPHADEPFEGYSTLPEAVRKRFDEAQAKAARAEALAASEAKLRNDRDAAIARVAPLQRELEKYRQGQPQRQQTQTPKPVGFDDWIKDTSKDYQRWANEFPEDARIQFEVAQRAAAMADTRIQSVKDEVEQRFSELRQRNELDRLARTHPDYVEFTATGPKAAEIRAWAESQGPDVQAALASDSADEVSAVLSTYKWEQSDPVVRETYADPNFQQWLGKQSRHIQSMARSVDATDRVDLMHIYIGSEYGTAKAGDPKTAARVQELTQRREQQSRTVSPSFRPNVAPASAANVGGEDAEWAAANARIEQWRKRQ